MNTVNEEELKPFGAPKLTPTRHVQLDECLQGGVPPGVTLLLVAPDPENTARVHPLVNEWLRCASTTDQPVEYAVYVDDMAFKALAERAMRDDRGVLCVMVARPGAGNPQCLVRSLNALSMAAAAVYVAPYIGRRRAVVVHVIKHREHSPRLCFEYSIRDTSGGTNG